MNDANKTGSPLNRAQAQQRVDRIRAFQEELEQLEHDQIVVLPAEQRQQLIRHHQGILAEFAKLFDVDTSATQKQMSLGMRIASFLGALALAASAFFFFYRIWGLISTPVQVLILICAPILAVLGVEIIAKREKYPYFTSLIGLVAFACFVLNLSIFGSIFNITPSQNAFLAWAALAMILAYGYGLRLLLVAGILCLLFFLSASVGEWCGMYWLSFGLRPENFLPAGIILFFLPTFVVHTKYQDFPGYYRVFGMLTVLIAILILSHWGEGSYLMLPPKDVKVLYQLLGFTAAGLTIWAGIRWHWQGVTNLGSTFFVIQLYTKFYDWWWDWMPKYLFFLVLGLVAILLLHIFQRLKLHLVQASA
jgi:uncharacterized membrane protein